MSSTTRLADSSIHEDADQSHIRTRAELAREDARALARARELLALFDAPEDDAPTLMGDREAVRAALAREDARLRDRTPALPIPLVTRRLSDDEWLASLPAGTRRRLELASAPLPPWPHSNRPLGAVSLPVRAIPSLRP